MKSGPERDIRVARDGAHRHHDFRPESPIVLEIRLGEHQGIDLVAAAARWPEPGHRDEAGDVSDRLCLRHDVEHSEHAHAGRNWMRQAGERLDHPVGGAVLDHRIACRQADGRVAPG